MNEQRIIWLIEHVGHDATYTLLRLTNAIVFVAKWMTFIAIVAIGISICAVSMFMLGSIVNEDVAIILASVTFILLLFVTFIAWLEDGSNDRENRWEFNNSFPSRKEGNE